MPKSEWTFADAKSQLSDVLDRAERAAQVITRRKRQYVVVAGDEFAKLTGRTRGLKDLILDGPSLHDVDLTRNPSPRRELDL